jgi:hypothetical protein
MSKLSLTTRKNIKDCEPKLQANLKKLTAATGITFDTEFDWLVLAPIAEEKGYKDRIGEVIYDWYLGGLADHVTRFCQDPIQKESFVETFGSAKRITFGIYEPEEGDYRYVRTRNDNGTLVIEAPKERFISNVSNTGEDLSKTCSGDAGPMTVATRKNIKDQEPARKKNLTRIQKATGVEFEVDVDWVVIAEACKEKSYEDRAGEVIYNWYLDGLASNIETFVKDPIQKESFVETFGEKKTIGFNLIKEEIDDESPHRYSYVWITNKDGVLEINLPYARFISNTSNTGDNLSKACSGDSPMSVATRKNISDNQKKMQGHLKTLKTASGIDFEVEVDWVVIATACKDKGYEDRAGEVVYDWYLGGLADHVKRFCEDPIQKESFVETFGERKAITLILEDSVDEESPHRYAYSWIVANGALEIHIPKERFISNTSNAGDNLSKACSGDSPMSVATRKNIKDNETSRKKNLTRIQKATGVEFEIEIDWVPFAAAAKDRGYEDRIGEVIYNWYLDGLADNLERLCKDEMCKEAVAEACGKKVIAFTLISNDEMEGTYQKCTFSDDGALVVSTSVEKFCSNTSNTGSDIESRL